MKAAPLIPKSTGSAPTFHRLERVLHHHRRCVLRLLRLHQYLSLLSLRRCQRLHQDSVWPLYAEGEVSSF